MKFDYYYGMESEQFTFFRIPRLLIRDRRFAGLSSNAKLLYGLMLDRMSLSMKNGWIDENNRTYIYYSMDTVMEDLCCAKSTCVRIMAELDDKKGIGLIEQVRQGQGRPDRIYVKNFASLVNDSDNNTDHSMGTSEGGSGGGRADSHEGYEGKGNKPEESRHPMDGSMAANEILENDDKQNVTV